MWRTRILLGSRGSERFIAEELWHILKAFGSLPPAITTVSRDLLQYEVSTVHVGGFPDPEMRYFIEVDSKLEHMHTEGVLLYSAPLCLERQSNLLPNQFNRFIIRREQVHNDSFLVKPKCQYSHVEYIHERIESVMKGWDLDWKMVLQRQWVCPYRNLLDASITFRCKPMYSCHIDVNGLPDVDTIKKYIATGLPGYFKDNYQLTV